jgi:hypothetical protein
MAATDRLFAGNVSPVSVVTPKSLLKSLPAEETQGIVHTIRSL